MQGASPSLLQNLILVGVMAFFALGFAWAFVNYRRQPEILRWFFVAFALVESLVIGAWLLWFYILR